MWLRALRIIIVMISSSLHLFYRHYLYSIPLFFFPSPATDHGWRRAPEQGPGDQVGHDATPARGVAGRLDAALRTGYARHKGRVRDCAAQALLREHEHVLQVSEGVLLN